MKRPICTKCGQRHVSINYRRGDKTYYRKVCDTCIRASKAIKPAKPRWAKIGYKKKLVCDKCHFKARWTKQMIVYYVDGDLNSTRLSNLKSICLNCSVSIEKQDMPWVKSLGVDPDN